MRVLVTGSAGVLGKPLVADLRACGHDVYGCDLMHTADRQSMRADIAEYRQLQRVFDWAKPDATYHLAGEFGRINGGEFAEQLWRTNCIGTHNVIEESIRTKSSMVFASSSEAYGSLADTELLTEELLDNRVPYFHNEYALSKWTNEKQIQTALARGLNSVILRFFNVYGPGEVYSPYRSVVCLFIYRLLHNLPITVYTRGRRSLLYVDDWVRTAAQAVGALSVIPNGAAINIGSDEQHTMAELLSIVLDTLHEKYGMSSESELTQIERESGNVNDKRPSLGRAYRYLQHSPAVSLREGIAKTVAWMREYYHV